VLDPEALDHIDDFLIEVRIAVEEQVLMCRVVGKCFAQLPDEIEERLRTADLVIGEFIAEDRREIN